MILNRDSVDGENRKDNLIKITFDEFYRQNKNGNAL